MTDRVLNQIVRMTGAVALMAWMGLAVGCATMDKDACLSADWRTIGFEDGAKGLAAAHIGRHRQACAEYGVMPNLAQYQEGRQQGLAEWCTPRNGYRIGRGGGRYNGVCPAGLESAFEDALAAGRREYDLRHEIDGQAGQLNRLIGELNQLEQDLQQAEEELVMPGIGPRRRRELLTLVRGLETDREALLAEISAREQSVDAAKIQLEQARRTSPYR